MTWSFLCNRMIEMEVAESAKLSEFSCSNAKSKKILLVDSVVPVWIKQLYVFVRFQVERQAFVGENWYSIPVHAWSQAAYYPYWFEQRFH